ncbi:MAG: hypothetical protein ACRD4T_04990, partial [Candidatus Acidiferrales bacterium]
LTGGAAQLEGLGELAAETLGVSARLGLPRGLVGANGTLANPGCTAVVGLVLHARRLRQASQQANGGIMNRLRNLLNGKTRAAGA